ncbi:MAG TPA: ATP-binding protein, partial [Phycisphaerae bacterium]|nr:ATP-binding protein [Phycisphaerae bacterium]
TTDAPLFRRRARISRYVRSRMTDQRQDDWRRDLARFAGCDLVRTFARCDQRVAAPSDAEIEQVMRRMGKFQPEDELNCGACGYETCREHAVAICKGLAESEMCLPYTIEQLRVTCQELTRSNEQLATTQEALMQSEKLASMGQLAAGIAHEVNNPLGTVLMLAHVLREEAPPESELHTDLSMIAREADRCKRIVSGLLHFARRNKVEAQMTDLRELLEHTLRMLPPPPGVNATATSAGDTWAEIDRDQIQQVLTNLITNAYAAMPTGGRLELSAQGTDARVDVCVRDTGHGIPAEYRTKIFEPFFSTKPAGAGTGLGLSVTYGIIKMHRGDIRVDSNADPAAGATGTAFTVTLPRRRINPPEELNHARN